MRPLNPREPAPRARLKQYYLISLIALLAITWMFRVLIKPLLIAILIAYILAPLVSSLQRIRVGPYPLPRWMAVLAIYASLLACAAGAVSLLAPRLMHETQQLIAEVPALSAKVRRKWIPAVERVLAGTTALYQAPLPTRSSGRASHDDAIKDRVSKVFDQLLSEVEHPVIGLLRQAKTVVRDVVAGIFATVLVLMASAYLVLTHRQIHAFFRGCLAPKHQRHYGALLGRIDRGLAGVVRGQLIICVVNGGLSGIGFYVADLSYWPVLTLVATVFSIIPIFGAILSSIPALIIALQQGTSVAVFVGVWILAIHQLEANVLNPKIVGASARLHPVLVMFAIVGAELLFGVLGALLAVPVLSIAASVFVYFRDWNLYRDRLPQGNVDAPPREHPELATTVGPD